MKSIDIINIAIDRIVSSVTNRLVGSSKPISCSFSMSPSVSVPAKDRLVGHLVVRAQAETYMEIEVRATGEFNVPKLKADDPSFAEIKRLAMATMYPYARAAIDQVALTMGMFSLNLPIIDTREFFSDNQVTLIEE